MATASDATGFGLAGQKRFRIYTRTGDGGTSCLYTGQRLHKDSVFFEALGDVDELNSWLGLAREHVERHDTRLASQLATIQSRLIDVGSAIATPASAPQGAKVGRTRFDPQHTATLEAWLDSMDDELPPLTQFILPSGGLAASTLHLARTVARRAERSAIALARLQAAPPPSPARSPAVDDMQPVTSAAAALSVSSTDGSGATESVVAGGVEQHAAEASAPVEDHVPAHVLDPAVRVYLNRLSDYLFTAARHMAKKEGRPEITYQKAA